MDCDRTGIILNKNTENVILSIQFASALKGTKIVLQKRI